MDAVEIQVQPAGSSAPASLDDAFAETVARLQDVWRELGATEAEKAEKLEEIRDEMAALLQGHIDDEIAEVDSIKKDIQDTIKHVEDMCNSLGLEAELPATDPQDSVRSQLVAIQALDRDVAEMFEERSAQLRELHDHIQALFKDLEFDDVNITSQFKEIGSDMTESRINDYEEQIAMAERELANREKAMSTVIEEVIDMWDELDMHPTSEFEHALLNNGQGLGHSMNVIERISALARSLSDIKAEREKEIQAMGLQITSLWDKLKVSEEERDRWLSSHCGLGQSVIDACKSKLQQLKLEMSAKLSTIVQDVRNTITALWDEMRYTATQRAEFSGMRTLQTSFTEAVLEEHEAYVAELEAEHAKMRPILKYIARREKLLEERTQYETAMADPGRLLNRRNHDPKRRLMEEKMERHVKKELPAITKKLHTLLRTWAQEHDGAHFLVNGVPYRRTMRDEDEAYEESRRQAKAAKEAARKAKLAADIEFGSSPVPKAKRTPSKMRMAAHAVSAFASPRKGGSTPTRSTPVRTRGTRTPGRTTPGRSGTRATPQSKSKGTRPSRRSNENEAGNGTTASSRAKTPQSRIPGPGSARKRPTPLKSTKAAGARTPSRTGGVRAKTAPTSGRKSPSRARTPLAAKNKAATARTRSKSPRQVGAGSATRANSGKRAAVKRSSSDSGDSAGSAASAASAHSHRAMQSLKELITNKPMAVTAFEQEPGTAGAVARSTGIGGAISAIQMSDDDANTGDNPCA